LYPQRHLLASLAVASVSLFFNQQVPFFSVELFGYNFTVFLLCFVFGVLIDVDHILDFRLNNWRMSESLETRFRKGRMFVVFHGIENIIILAGLSIAFPFLVFPLISYSLHMMMDIQNNGVSFRAYFYIIRFGKMILSHRIRTHNKLYAHGLIENLR